VRRAGDQIIRYGERVIERDRSPAGWVKTKSSVSQARWFGRWSGVRGNHRALAEDTEIEMILPAPDPHLVSFVDWRSERRRTLRALAAVEKVSSTAKAIPARRPGVADHWRRQRSAPVASRSSMMRTR